MEEYTLTPPPIDMILLEQSKEINPDTVNIFLNQEVPLGECKEGLVRTANAVNQYIKNGHSTEGVKGLELTHISKN